jgi:NAD-dependent dihydropyrimidine dehydrogenase PreA subunit
MITIIDAHLCIGCGACEMLCPADVIRMSPETNKAVIAYGRDCWTCFTCELECPVDAIEVDPIKKQKPNICDVKTSLAEVGHDTN